LLLLAGDLTGASVTLSVREVLICRRAHGLPAPEGLTDELFRQICDFDAWLWFTLYGKRKFCAVSFRKGVERVYAHLQAVVDVRTASPSSNLLTCTHLSSIV
jgi:lysophosphatidic acid phosphatase type 6